jgi:hypothetical protein
MRLGCRCDGPASNMDVSARRLDGRRSNLKGPIHDQSCCATLRVVQHDWPCMVLIDVIVNGQTCVAQNTFAQHDWSCMGRITAWAEGSDDRIILLGCLSSSLAVSVFLRLARPLFQTIQKWISFDYKESRLIIMVRPNSLHCILIIISIHPVLRNVHNLCWDWVCLWISSWAFFGLPCTYPGSKGRWKIDREQHHISNV